LAISPWIFFFLTSRVCKCFSSSSVWISPIGFFCYTGLVDINWCSLSLSWKLFISPMNLKDRLVGHGLLGW
jgi:hypothetical protein